MTWEEAIHIFENSRLVSEYFTSEALTATYVMALSALRPVSRERVEKVWRGEWMFPIFVGQTDANDPRCQCSECGSIETPLARHRFCPACGAPMTDEAVQMVMEKMEAIKDGKND